MPPGRVSPADYAALSRLHARGRAAPGSADRAHPGAAGSWHWHPEGRERRASRERFAMNEPRAFPWDALPRIERGALSARSELSSRAAAGIDVRRLGLAVAELLGEDAELGEVRLTERRRGEQAAPSIVRRAHAAVSGSRPALDVAGPSQTWRARASRDCSASVSSSAGPIRASTLPCAGPVRRWRSRWRAGPRAARHRSSIADAGAGAEWLSGRARDPTAGRQTLPAGADVPRP